MEMPFPQASFDAVFSSGSLHEWENPKKSFDEIDRVLKPGGRYIVCDLRRNINPLLKWMTYFHHPAQGNQAGIFDVAGRILYCFRTRRNCAAIRAEKTPPLKASFLAWCFRGQKLSFP